MINVTYLLGAGASFHSMPLLNGMNERLKIYRNFVFHAHKQKLITHPQTTIYSEEFDKLIKNIE